jgi:purine-binding chemotaxis protein CheW
VIFHLDDRRYALSLAAVERIVRVVELTPLPAAPAIILGIINVSGEVVPVFNVRRRFHLAERDIDLSDHLIVARTGARTVALVVDCVAGVIERSPVEGVPMERILQGLDFVASVMKLADGLIVIHDLETFLSLEEQQILERVLTHHFANHIGLEFPRARWSDLCDGCDLLPKRAHVFRR